MIRQATLLILLFASVAFSSAIAAYAGGGGAAGSATGGATELTQLANNDELIAIYAEEVEQVSNQLEQISNQLKIYNDMLQQGMSLPTSYLNDVVSQFTSLKRAVTQTVGLYESWGNMASSLEKMWEQSLSGDALTNALTRSKQSKATLSAIANKIDQTVNQIDNDNQVIEDILQRSANATGRMQAIQAGTEMAAATAQEVNKLRMDVNVLSSQLLAMEAERQLQAEEALAAKEELLTGLKDGIAKPSFTTIFDK